MEEKKKRRNPPNRTKKPLIVELDENLLKQVKIIAIERGMRYRELVSYALEQTFNLKA